MRWEWSKMKWTNDSFYEKYQTKLLQYFPSYSSLLFLLFRFNAKETNSYDDWFIIWHKLFFSLWAQCSKFKPKTKKFFYYIFIISHLNCLNTFLIALCSILTPSIKKNKCPNHQDPSNVPTHSHTINNYYFLTDCTKFRIVL